MRIKETIEVKQNLKLTMRERGKIVAKREGHNIWLDLGREYLAQLISYSLLAPLTPVRNDRIRYMGLGIGGNRQLIPSIANVVPFSTAYPGANSQTDSDATVTTLERPVRLAGGVSVPPYVVTDTWLGQIQAPPDFGSATQVTYKRLFTQLEISYNPYLSVPLSEVMLFTNAAAANVYNNTGVAYDTFDTLSKTNAFELEIDWTIKF